MGKLSRRIAAVIAGIVLAGGAGVAYAIWSETSTGTASASATDLLPATVSAATATPTLYPGATGDAFVSVKNPNAFAVKVLLHRTGASSDKPGCGGGNIAFPDRTITLGANQVTPNLVLSNAVTMDNDAPNACQNAVFTISLSTTTTVGNP